MSRAKIIAPQMCCPVMNSGFIHTYFPRLPSRLAMSPPASVAPAGRHNHLDIGSLEGLVQSLYAKGIADSTRSTYSTAQCRYLAFWSNFGITPLPLSEHTLCLFAAYLANQGLQGHTISAYLSGLRYLQISSGLQAPAFSSWPWLHYVTRGIKRSQPTKDVRLTITLSVLKKLKQVWLGEESEPASYESHLFWAIACTAFFGFLRLGEVFPPTGNSTSPLLLSNLGTGSHLDPTFFHILIRKAKNDPFGKGSFVFLGRTDKDICPTQALKRYLMNCPPGQGALFQSQDGSPCSRDHFVHAVRHTLSKAGLNTLLYAGHSFRIGAATTAAAAGIPAHTIKRLGRWSSDAYTLYVRQSDSFLLHISTVLTNTSGC